MTLVAEGNGELEDEGLSLLRKARGLATPPTRRDVVNDAFLSGEDAEDEDVMNEKLAEVELEGGGEERG